MTLRKPLLRLAFGVLALTLAGTALWAAVFRKLPRKERLARAAKARKELLRTLAWKEAPKSCEVHIFKAQRRLELLGDGKAMVSTRCALGGSPEGDKVREGDSKTPEGEFYVCTRNDRSRFHLFLGLSYPNEEDAARGLRDKLINEAESKAIVAAQTRRSRPPWNTELGGMIGIHGYGTAYDWTLGCVALSDEDIERLWGFCPLGTVVKIFP